MESHLKNIFIRLKSRKVVYICSEIPVLFYFRSNFFSCIQVFTNIKICMRQAFKMHHLSVYSFPIFFWFVQNWWNEDRGGKKLKRVRPSVHPSIRFSQLGSFFFSGTPFLFPRFQSAVCSLWLVFHFTLYISLFLKSRALQGFHLFWHYFLVTEVWNFFLGRWDFFNNLQGLLFSFFFWEHCSSWSRNALVYGPKSRSVH